MRSRNGLILAGTVGAAVLAAVVTRHQGAAPAEPAADEAKPSVPSAPPASAVPTSPAPARGREAFVGSAACAPCHRAQSDAYLGSHHAKALVTPPAEPGNSHFDGGHFASKQGGATTFALQGGAPVVTTPGSDGKPHTFPISYISGVWPLEQYVVATERGKLQSLGVVWDSRTPAEDGNHWFHVYGTAGVAPSDPLFFTSPAQNWNQVCADCHSTRVERGYDVETDSFDTRWAELSVGCEACHGPGAEHVRSAQAGGPVAHLPASLKRSEPWQPSATGSPTPRTRDDAEVEVCAQCHSSRKPIQEGFIAGDPFLDSFEPELLRAGRYHADGQVQGEVYEWGSFLQSRMYHAGVRCSDCHEPHTSKLYASGNALCVRCHEPKHFDVESHSHHAGPQAPRCIDCHMPPATFMQIDERRDHSIRIPRPDRSVDFGTPNGCNICHTKQPASWASDALAGWFPSSQKRTHLLDALSQDRAGALEAPSALRALANDAAAPAITRATALERLGRYPTEKTRQALQAALSSSQPLLVYGAALGAAQLPPQQRLPLLLPALVHPRRAVRVTAAKALAGAHPSDLPSDARAALERAFVELEQRFAVAASRPETHVERSAFELARGNTASARAALETALRLQPCLAEAYLNLADLERQRGDESAAERAIRSALKCDSKNAAAHHALGLWQIRAHQSSAALVSLQKAVELSPADPRFSYVYAVALAQAAELPKAIEALEASLTHRANDANALQALAGYLAQAGQSERAAETRRKLETLLRE